MDDAPATVAQYAELALSMTEAEFMEKVTRPVLIEKVEFFGQGHQSPLSGTVVVRDTIEMPGLDAIHLSRAKVFTLKKKPGSIGVDIFVGRAPTNDIILPNPSVSKSHAHFTPALGTDHLQLVDMFSSNGTFLNGQKIHPFEKHQVKDYDEIRFGPDYLVIFCTPRIFYQMLKSIKP
jgi:pSer/pThr/pTyr-binding forkhead associated (FHA) protein